MRRAAIVMPMRTPVGLPGGALGAVAPHRLIATALSAVLGRSGIEPERIEHLVTAIPTPEPARLAADLAGIPPAIGHFPIGAGPGGGLHALITAAMMVQTGTADVVLAVGAEYPRTGTVPGGSDPGQPPAYPAGFVRRGNGESGVPPRISVRSGADGPSAARAEGAARAALERVERLAAHYGFTRVQADEVAAASHRRAAKARRQGVFGTETAPVVVCADPDDMNSDVVQLMDRDEGLRDDVSPRAFSTLLPLLPGGITTTANSSARTFAAAACLVVAEERLADLDLEPLGYLVGWVNAAVDPADPLPASAAAAAKVLSRNGFELGDLDLVEADESDAVEILALEHLWGDWDPEDTRLNVHGGAIALGDPGGAAGLRMVTTLLHELSRRQGGRGLAVTASGTSQSLAVLFETPHSRPIAPTPRGARFHGSRSRRSGRHRA
ncbi:Probable acetyl-CoA acyltransferase [Nocardia otitidiscaviarum]|uniref:Probable acetyl-CoA acetyltransferase n=1 Tax=Nocardia otitidiscaviarum TaxID=1823 RepID=A0A378YD97_9NOCA|nr:hypothetical protein [Nocardia otitidiscaviarum]SUA74510.1 Probable acetyl-CoA acyltransferase [Nocardia otitidiscaviarum]